MPTTVPVAALAARTTSGQSAAVEVPPHGSDIAVLVNCTADSGTSPTLDITVEWSDDGTRWFRADPAQAFTQITGVLSPIALAKRVPSLGKFMRAAWAIAGTTPSFSFSVDFWMPV